MARARTVRVYLKKFYEEDTENPYTEFDDDEYVDCIAYGNLPRPLVDRINDYQEKRNRIIHDPESSVEEVQAMEEEGKELRREEFKLLVREWVIRNEDGSVYPLPREDEYIMERMPMNVSTAVMRAIVGAWNTPQGEKIRLGEAIASAQPSEESDDTRTLRLSN